MGVPLVVRSLRNNSKSCPEFATQDVPCNASPNNLYIPWYKAHLQGIGFEFFNSDQKRVEKLFDLEDNTFKNQERENEIKQLLVEIGIPFLMRISTKNGLLEAITEYNLDKRNRLRPLLRTHLGLPVVRHI